jgi:hypothetical protein
MLGREYQSLNNSESQVKTTTEPKPQNTGWSCLTFLNFFKKEPKPATLDAQWNEALVDSKESPSPESMGGMKKP